MTPSSVPWNVNLIPASAPHRRLRREARKRPRSHVAGGVPQLALDPEKLVVLGDTVAPGGSTGLDLAGSPGHREVGDGGVLRLAGTMADHSRVPAPDGQPDGLGRLG